MTQSEETELIFSYSREDALADGVLIDVSELAREAGFKYPVAITNAAFAEAVAISNDDVGQDETGRLWDVLNLLRYSIGKSTGAQINFKVSVLKGQHHETIELKSLCHAGDDFEPVITIMLPTED